MTIKQKQHLLAYLNYYTATVDGIWGSRSRQATAAFQQDQGLTADGVFGADTTARILKVIAAGESEEEPFWDHIRYWTREEFACRCGEYHEPYCTGYPTEPDQVLVELLEDIRSHFDRPAIPSSGLRCPQHNADSGGVANSRHLTGKAMDFWIPGISGEAICRYAAADPRCRYAYVIGGDFGHVDVA